MVIDVKVELCDRNFASSIRADDLNLACFRQRFIISAEEEGDLELLRVVQVHHLRMLLGHSKGVEHLGSFRATGDAGLQLDVPSRAHLHLDQLQVHITLRFVVLDSMAHCFESFLDE